MIIAGPIRGLETATGSCGVDGTGRGVVTGEGYVDAMFTASRLAALLEGEEPFALLHLGTHFELRPGNAARSTLLLGDGSRLSLDEIGQLDFRGLELVTLLACQTGVGGGTLDDPLCFQPDRCSIIPLATEARHHDYLRERRPLLSCL